MSQLADEGSIRQRLLHFLLLPLRHKRSGRQGGRPEAHPHLQLSCGRSGSLLHLEEAD